MSDNSFNLGTVIDDAKKIITDPVGFYREMPTSGGYSNPLIFVVVMAAITGLLISVYSLFGFGMPGAVMAGGFALAAIIMFPIMAVIGSFIGAAIIFVIWKLMGSEKNYEVAYRCAAYSFAIGPIVLLISIVPYLAGVIKTLWACFLMFIASIEVHKIKPQTAKIVFGIFAVIGVVFGISSEHTVRNFQHSIENYKLPSAFKDLENMEDMSAEEAGKAMGEMMKGLGEFSKGLEASMEEAKKEAEKQD